MTLLVRDLRACYGKSEVLHGVRLEVAPGEIVALLGRNGVGRSTCAKAIMGLLSASGSVSWRGQPLLGRPAHEIARLGILGDTAGGDVAATGCGVSFSDSLGS